MTASDRGALATAFLAGVVVGAVVVVAVVLLRDAHDPIVQAAAMIPLAVALVVAGAVVVVSRRGGGQGAPAVQPEAAASSETDEAAEDEAHLGGGEAVGDGEGVAVEEAGDFAIEEFDRQVASGSSPRTVAEPDEESDADGTSGDASDIEPEPEAPAASVPESTGTSAPIDPASLIGAWQQYRKDGDGFFTANGLRTQLESLGLVASVREGSAVDAAGDVMVVEAESDDGDRFFVLPSFIKSPAAAPDWFDDAGGGALSARTRTIHRLAEGKWTDSSFKVVQRGTIE